MKDRADKGLSSNFFRVVDWADPLASPAVLYFIVECATGKHF
ncbi:MAG: hypothetical protein SWO11_00550 [Thermodesulfobacteriota bacterium]|nr:hypothetical protein [Thermodesulfobacteriota bacterium]